MLLRFYIPKPIRIPSIIAAIIRSGIIIKQNVLIDLEISSFIISFFEDRYSAIRTADRISILKITNNITAGFDNNISGDEIVIPETIMFKCKLIGNVIIDIKEINRNLFFCFFILKISFRNKFAKYNASPIEIKIAVNSKIPCGINLSNTFNPCISAANLPTKPPTYPLKMLENKGIIPNANPKINDTKLARKLLKKIVVIVLYMLNPTNILAIPDNIIFNSDS